MQSFTKDELRTMLSKLREGKDKKESYDFTPKSFAMCYSMAFPLYDSFDYVGNHICHKCGKKFGQSLEECINECRERMYEKYKEKENFCVTSDRHPCFMNCLHAINSGEESKYLKEHDLEGSCESQDFSTGTHLFRKKEKGVALSFNRKLTKEEWMELNNDCYDNKDKYGCYEEKCCCQCFEHDKKYESYEKIAGEYVKAGFDVVLRYNCPDCCDKGANKLEFCFKLKDEKDYIVSYPDFGNYSEKNKNKLTEYIDYAVALEFLKGNTSYESIIKKLGTNDDIVRKSQIDDALNTIIGTNIKYDKSEIWNYINKFYKEQAHNFHEEIALGSIPSEGNINEENLLCKVVKEVANTVLDCFDDNYEFSLSEYFLFMGNIALLRKSSTDDLSRLDLGTREKYVLKLTLSEVAKKNMFVSKREVEQLNETKYPYDEIDEYYKKPNLDEYDKKHLERLIYERKTAFGYFEKLYKDYGDEYRLDINKYVKISNILKKAFRDTYGEDNKTISVTYDDIKKLIEEK